MTVPVVTMRGSDGGAGLSLSIPPTTTLLDVALNVTTDSDTMAPEVAFAHHFLRLVGGGPSVYVVADIVGHGPDWREGIIIATAVSNPV
jgi:hypothetical protein